MRGIQRVVEGDAMSEWQGIKHSTMLIWMSSVKESTKKETTVWMLEDDEEYHRTQDESSLN
jgi:hypothetical protein